MNEFDRQLNNADDNKDEDFIPVADDNRDFISEEFNVSEIINQESLDSAYEEEISADAEEKAQRENKKRTARLEVYDWIQCIVSTLIAVILIFIFVGRQIGVVGTSMSDTLYPDDSVFVTNMLYKPAYGDIVIIKVDGFDGVPLVKRIIGTEGQTIDIDFDTHEVIVDGEVLNEPYIRELTTVSADFDGPVVVPEGCVFVMGDNRNASTDSRSDSVGFVDVRNILGKVRFVIMPGKGEYGVRDWSRLGSVYRTMP